MTSLLAAALCLCHPALPGQDPVGGKQEQPKQERRFVPERAFQLNKLQTATCKIGKHVFQLWVMDTDAKRQEGMMHLKDSDFKDDEGMIFVFPYADARRFWMHNTLVPLDITYNGADGKILNVYTMKAMDEDTDYSSAGPALTVIELRAKLLSKLEITPGMKWEIPESVVAKD